MEIIDFPGRSPRAIKTDEHKMELGPMRFSCDCGEVTHFSLTGAIFRYLDFFCGECGTHYEVKNPAFVRPASKKPK